MMGALLFALGPQYWPDSLNDAARALTARVEVHRTGYGVPHILADDLKAMGFGLGCVQLFARGELKCVAWTEEEIRAARNQAVWAKGGGGAVGVMGVPRQAFGATAVPALYRPAPESAVPF